MHKNSQARSEYKHTISIYSLINAGLFVCKVGS